MTTTSDSVDAGFARPVAQQVFDDFDLLMEDVDYPAINHVGYIPSRESISEWVENFNVDIGVKSALDAIPSLDFVNTPRTVFEGKDLSKIAALLMWGGEELVRSGISRKPSSLIIHQDMLGKANMRELIFSSAWNLNGAVTTREVGLTYLFVKDNLPNITVGEISVAVAQDRHLFATTSITSLHVMGSHKESASTIVDFRKVTSRHTALIWFTLLLKSYTDIRETVGYKHLMECKEDLIGLALAYPLDILMPFFMSGVWDEDLIAQGIANNIDPSTLAAFGVGGHDERS